MAETQSRPLGTSLLQYNARIVVLNSYWLFVAPLVASQLIIFWHMAMQSLTQGSAVFVAHTTEIVAPIFAAFLCAQVLAPEYRYRLDDLVFSRPVSFTRTVVARLATMYVFLTLLIALMLFVYKIGLKAEFDLRMVVLAGLPPVLFLSTLSLAIAAVWHSPTAGIAVAGTIWAADVVVGAKANPLLTLHSYAVGLANDDTASPEWLVSKLVLLAAALVLALIAARAVGRPASPIKWRTIVKTAIFALVLILGYVISGAAYNLKKIEVLETDPLTLNDARRKYQEAFMVYGRLPVAYVFGRDFANYIGYPVTHMGIFAELRQGRRRMINQLTSVVFDHPHSRWADNAFFELIRAASVLNEGDSQQAADNESQSETTQTEKPYEAIDRRAAFQYCHQFLRDYAQSPFAPLVGEKLIALAGAMGDEATQRQTLDLLLKSYPSSPATLSAAQTLTMAYASKGRIAEAIAIAEQAVAGMATEGGKADITLALGDFLRAQNRQESARRAYEQAVRIAQAEVDALQSEQKAVGRADERLTELRSGARGLMQRAQTALDEMAKGLPPAPPPPPQTPPRGRPVKPPTKSP